MKIICVGRNYVAHAAELGNEVPDSPMLFMKPHTALLIDNKPLYYPDFTNDLHYEAELVLKICKNGRHIQPEFADSYRNTIETELQGITLPAAGGGAAESDSLAGQIDLSQITATVTRVLGELAPMLEGLPAAGDTLGALRETLDWVERLASGELPSRNIATLSRRLSEELGGNSTGGFADILLRLTDVFGSSRLTQLLRDLVSALTRAAGVDIPADAFRPPEIAQAIVTAVRVLGGLTSLETILAEAERLTGVMADQLHPDEIQAQRNRINAFLGSGPGALATFLAATQPAVPAQLEAARAAITGLESQFLGFRDQLAEGMGYGEATLVFLDLTRAQNELALASRLVHETDSSPLERTLSSLGARITPFISLDLAGAPARGFEEVVTLLEARVASVAAGIAAFDVSQISGPLTAFIQTATDLPSRLNAAISQVTTTIRSALESVRAVVERLPLDDLGSAIRQALDPVRQLLEFLSNLLGMLMEALQAALVAVRTPSARPRKPSTNSKPPSKPSSGTPPLSSKASISKESSARSPTTSANSPTSSPRPSSNRTSIPPPTPSAPPPALSKMSRSAWSPIPMEQEIVDALRPIKTADVDAFQAEIESLLQLGPDGTFQLRPRSKPPSSPYQVKYDALIAEVRRLDPRAAIAPSTAASNPSSNASARSAPRSSSPLFSPPSTNFAPPSVPST